MTDRLICIDMLQTRFHDQLLIWRHTEIGAAGDGQIFMECFYHHPSTSALFAGFIQAPSLP